MTIKECDELKSITKANIDNLSQIVSDIRETASKVWKTRYKALYCAVRCYSALDKPISIQFANIRTAYDYGFISPNRFEKIQAEFMAFRSDAFYFAIQRAVFILNKTIKNEEQTLKNIETDLLIKGDIQ